MLGWVVTFLLIALIAALLGFGGIAAASAGIAKFLFDDFGDVLDLVVGPRRPGTLYSRDRVFGCHRTACPATRIP
jgi:uncharacterized membrane protein YtjA (UPF0391 family)